MINQLTPKSLALNFSAGNSPAVSRRLRSQGFALLLAAIILLSIASSAQTRPLTAADYARAEKFLTYNTTPLVLRSGVRPTWLPDERFWYRTMTENGAVYEIGRASCRERV